MCILFLLFEINYIFIIKKANIRHFQVWYFDGGYERVQKEHAGLKFVQLDQCLLTRSVQCPTNFPHDQK